MGALFEVGDKVVVVMENTSGREWLKKVVPGGAKGKTVSLPKGTQALVIHDQPSGSTPVRCTVPDHPECLWLLPCDSIDVISQ